MAARKYAKFHSETVRQKIRGSQLVNMLDSVALKGTYNGQIVDPVRVQAAKILLGKYIPDLQSMAVQAEGDTALGVILVPGKGK